MKANSTHWARAVAAAVSMVLVTLVVGAVAGPSAADDIDDQRAAAEARGRDLQAAKDELAASLENTDAALAQAAVDLAAIQARLPQARAELAAAEREVERTAREADLLAQRLQDAQDSEKQIAAQVALDAQRVEGAKETIAQMAREAVRGTGEVSSLGIVTGAQSAEEFVQLLAASSTAARNQARLLDEVQRAESIARNRQVRLAAIRQTVAELKRQADENLALARVARQEAADRKAEIDRLVAEQQAKQATIEAAKVATLAQIDQNDRDRADLVVELKAIIAAQTERDRRIAEAKAKAEREAKERAERQARERAEREARARAEREARASSSGAGSSGAGSSGAGSSGAGSSGGGSSSGSAAAPAARSGYLSSPVSNLYVTSSYGMRMHPILGYVRMHWGTDLRAYCGVPIMAAAGGRVAIVTTWADGTNQIVIDHGSVEGESLMTGYLHLSRFAVSKGQEVSRGQVIGYSGTTGLSNACHLHFEVYVNGKWVDPMSRL